MSLPEIVTDYGSFTPPANIAADVRLILRHVPPRYLAGLHHVRLAVTADFNRERRRQKTRRRGRIFAINSAAGLYHAAWRGQPASIELFVDNTFAGAPAWVLRIPPLRRTLLSATLYHELGHHIHSTVAPKHAEREDVADQWSIRLSRRFLFHRYWYLLPLIYPAVLIARLAGARSRPPAAA